MDIGTEAMSPKKVLDSEWNNFIKIIKDIFGDGDNNEMETDGTDIAYDTMHVAYAAMKLEEMSRMDCKEMKDSKTTNTTISEGIEPRDFKEAEHLVFIKGIDMEDIIRREGSFGCHVPLKGKKVYLEFRKRAFLLDDKDIEDSVWAIARYSDKESVNVIPSQSQIRQLVKTLSNLPQSLFTVNVDRSYRLQKLPDASCIDPQIKYYQTLSVYLKKEKNELSSLSLEQQGLTKNNSGGMSTPELLFQKRIFEIKADDRKRKIKLMERFKERVKCNLEKLGTTVKDGYLYLKVVKEPYLVKRNNLLKEIAHISLETQSLIKYTDRWKENMRLVLTKREQLLKARARRQFRTMKQKYDGLMKRRTCRQVFRLHGKFKHMTRSQKQIYLNKLVKARNNVRLQIHLVIYKYNSLEIEFKKCLDQSWARIKYFKLVCNKRQVLEQKLSRLNCIVQEVEKESFVSQTAHMCASGCSRVVWYPPKLKSKKFVKHVAWWPVLKTY